MRAEVVSVCFVWLFSVHVSADEWTSAKNLNQFTKICFEKDNVCYFYSNNTVVFSSLEKIQSQCPDQSWLITVFNKTIQGHLKTIISRLRANNQYSKIVLSLKAVDKNLFWMFSNESKVPITYENWNVEKMAPNECSFISEEHAYRWQTDICSGLTRVVCMSKLCRWTWEKVESREMTFEKGTRITTITSLNDCKTYCELLEKACIGVYISYWSHCWVFAKLVNHGRVEPQVLHIKSPKSVCTSTHGALADRYKWHLATDEKADKVLKRQAEPEAAPPPPAADGWEKAPDEEGEDKSILEPLHILMKLLTFGAISFILLIRVATWLFSKLGKKKDKMADD